jgi:probable phosphoglycerate mutase
METKLELWLVRHGETEWNAEGRWQGQTDVHLSELGREQARRLARRLEGEHFNAVISSDLMRAHETARIVASKLGGKPDVYLDRRWREIHVGALSGLTANDALTRGLGRWSRPFEERYPDGESRADMAIRVGHALTDLAQQRRSGRVIVFTHGGTIKSAFGVLMQDPQSPFWTHFGPTANTAISRFQVALEATDDTTEGEPGALVRGRLLGFNDSAHLETGFLRSATENVS